MTVDPAHYYPAPQSLIPLLPDVRKALIGLGSLSVLSALSAFAVVVFVTQRICRNPKRELNNQCLILVYNLMFADFIQSISVSISFRWLAKNGILAPDGWCWAQAGLLNFGNVGSGMFVLAIAVETLYLVVWKKRLPYFIFVTIVVGIWLLNVLLCIVGPLEHGRDFYTRASNWCWISAHYEGDRLALHYVWIFIVQAFTIVIYSSLSVYLRLQTRQLRHMSGSSSSTAQVHIRRAARTMMIYPVIYVAVTLPKATGRMIAMAGGTVPQSFTTGADVLLSSAGWLDALVYSFTRKILFTADRAATRGSFTISRVGSRVGSRISSRINSRGPSRVSSRTHSLTTVPSDNLATNTFMNSISARHGSNALTETATASTDMGLAQALAMDISPTSSTSTGLSGRVKNRFSNAWSWAKNALAFWISGDDDDDDDDTLTSTQTSISASAIGSTDPVGDDRERQAVRRDTLASILFEDEVLDNEKIEEMRDAGMMLDDVRDDEKQKVHDEEKALEDEGVEHRDFNVEHDDMRYDTRYNLEQDNEHGSGGEYGRGREHEHDQEHEQNTRSGPGLAEIAKEINR